MKRTLLLSCALVCLSVSLPSCAAPFSYEGKYTTSFWDGQKLLITPKVRPLPVAPVEQSVPVIIPSAK